MSRYLKVFQDLYNSQQIKMINEFFDGIQQKFKIFFIMEFHGTPMINNANNEIKVIIFDTMKYQGEEYAIFCFEQTIIIISFSNISFLKKFFENHNDSKFVSISNESANKLDTYLSIDEQESKEMKKIYSMISSNESGRLFYSFIIKKPTNKRFNEIWQKIRPSILCFIVKKSYNKIGKDSLSDFDEDIKQEIELNRFNYISIKRLGSGNSSIDLICHLGLEQLFAMKVFSQMEQEKLFEREKRNYEMIHHHSIPKFYGVGKIGKDKCLLIEYIKGTSLGKIDEMNLNKKEKISLIYDLLQVIQYLHENGFIYRDLKPNSFIINESKKLVLLDFDRMLTNDDEQITENFDPIYCAPEIINEEEYSCEVDIYSLGMIVYFIIMERKVSENDLAARNIFDDFGDEFAVLGKIFENCINTDKSKRPKINDLVQHYEISIIQPEEEEEEEIYFYVKKNEDEVLEHFYIMNKDNPNVQFAYEIPHKRGIYYERDVDKAIRFYQEAAEQNDVIAQYNLGVIYEKGQYVRQDIDKAIYYYTLAAKQNDPNAQFNLGLIYANEFDIRQDLIEAIHYLSLAASQNHPQAQAQIELIYSENEYLRRRPSYDPENDFILGLAYERGDSLDRDISKAIYYYSRAAKNNHKESMFSLGLLYYDGEYIQKDISKAIYYFSLAANQNEPISQSILGSIYYEGEYVKRDVNKAIHYYSLASQNDPEALFNLGLIYYKGEYIQRDINKAIHYFTLAANNNCKGATNFLGSIYYEGEYVKRDVNKALHYYSLASKNDPKALFNLGVIYYKGEYIQKDINKAIHYFTLAANNNYKEAQFILGVFYYDGEIIKKNANMSIRYFMLSAGNGFIDSHFALGVIYSQGIYVQRNIDEAIHYYNNGSNRNDGYSKNNLGIIYKYYQYKRDPVEYFEEASRQKDDYLSMYNLAHIYFYGEKVNVNIEKAIELLIRSSLKGLTASKSLLALALTKKITKITMESIKEEIIKIDNQNLYRVNKLALEIFDFIQGFSLENDEKYDFFYSVNQKIYYVYDIHKKPVMAEKFWFEREQKEKEEAEKNKNLHEVNQYFYEGFGNELYCKYIK